MQRAFILFLVCVAALARTHAEEELPGTAALTGTTNLSEQMVQGIDAFLMQSTKDSEAQRAGFWSRDNSSPEAYDRSVAANRERLRTIIGAVDKRVPVRALEFVSITDRGSKLAETESYVVHAIRWPVFEGGVYGEGLLLKPRSKPVARVVAIPDADQSPEMLVGLEEGIRPEHQFARRLVEQGCEVIIPVLINRQDKWSGNARLGRYTNQPHREWIYRQAFEMGRHIIGYEVQKVLAAVDWLVAQPGNTPVGVIGYGEGGLLTLYAAAIDTRIQVAAVSGYFTSRQRLWEEPIYRNLFGLLREFGDAEIASLIGPRQLLVEHSESPTVSGPPRPRSGRSGAAAGRWQTPDFNEVEAEVERANKLLSGLPKPVQLVHGNEGTTVGPGSDSLLGRLLSGLGAKQSSIAAPGKAASLLGEGPDSELRQQRQVEQLVEHSQRLLRVCDAARQDSFWKKLKYESPQAYEAALKPLKQQLWNELIGKLPDPTGPLNPRSRKSYDREKWTGYDVTLEVYPGVFAWGVLLVPKDIRPGEKRPVVVCQHGLEGLPADTIVSEPKSGPFAYYKAFSAQLAEQGFVVFAPHNPYRGGEAFRVLQRKAHPLKASIFSVILAQHQRILDWLEQQPFVDRERIGFYGLSYGGKTAMRVPALLERYCLSICSADFNDWAKKCATIDSGYSYLYTVEYDMYEFNLGHTFSYAEMAGMIAPRPFMVERGHQDGVAPDEWVAYEYATVRRLYDTLELPERTRIEFFNGPHTIHGEGTFNFLRQQLRWPPARPANKE